MKREDKYRNTDTFRFYNANPKGKYTTDCVVRAVSLAMNKPYETVLRELVELQIKTGYSLTDVKALEKYLNAYGYEKQKQPRKANGTKYTGAEFCKWFGEGSAVIANMGSNHVTVIIDGKVNDTWNCTGGAVGNYWIIRE